MERRHFLSAMGALMALDSSPVTAGQPEVGNYWTEVPAGATLWALAVFCADEPIEFRVGMNKDIQTVRGRYDAQRLKELSWTNHTSTLQRIVIRATALAGERELPPTRVEYLSEHHMYLGFGRRGIPEKPADRHGSYPYEAVLIGFFTFG